MGWGHQRPDTQGGVRLATHGRRLEAREIQIHRLVHTSTIGDEVGKCVGQTKMGRQLGSIVRTAQNPDVGLRAGLWVSKDTGAWVGCWQRCTTEPSAQFQNLLGEIVRGVTVGIEELRSFLVTARCPAHPQIDAPWGQGIQNPELLGHFEGGVVGQHDPRTANANALGFHGNGRHQNLWSRAQDTGVRVVLAHPKPVITKTLGCLRQLHRLCNGVLVGATFGVDRLIQHGQLNAHGESLCSCAIEGIRPPNDSPSPTSLQETPGMAPPSVLPIEPPSIELGRH